ncbi:hypothetical protein GH733_007374, partial [Mirounga leonina]
MTAGGQLWEKPFPGALGTFWFRGEGVPSLGLMTRGFAPILPTEFHKMGSFRRPRPRFMSSPVLSDLPRFQAARQALQLSSNSAWNSVQTAVINVFKGGGLQSNELYALNENIRYVDGSVRDHF